MRNTKLFSALALSFLFASSAANAQILTIEEMTIGANDFFVFNINPNGVVFDTINFELDPAGGSSFVNTETTTGTAMFTAKFVTADTDVLGLNTVAMGWSFLNSKDALDGFDATVGPLGAKITNPVDVLQAVLPSGDSGTYLFNFANSGSLVNSLSGTFGGSDPNMVDPNNTPPVVDSNFTDPNGYKFWDQKVVFNPSGSQNYQIGFNDLEDPNATVAFQIDSIEGPLDVFGNVVPGTGINNAPSIATGGLLTWDTTGTSQANYFINFTVTDSGGLTDTGVLRVSVPEPGTIALAGLSLVGLFARRRKQG